MAREGFRRVHGGQTVPAAGGCACVRTDKLWCMVAFVAGAGNARGFGGLRVDPNQRACVCRLLEVFVWINQRARVCAARVDFGLFLCLGCRIAGCR